MTVAATKLTTSSGDHDHGFDASGTSYSPAFGGGARHRAAAEAGAPGLRAALSLEPDRTDLARRRNHGQQCRTDRRHRLQDDVLGGRMMFDMIEGALATRTATDPTSPLVVSVPHAGVAHGGFETHAESRAGRALRRRPVRRSPLPRRRAGGARGLRGGPDFALRLRPEPRSRRRRAGRGARAPGAAQHRRPRLHLGGHDDRRARPGAAADARRVARADRASTPPTTTPSTRALERARDRFGYAILLDGHSMPSRGRTGHKDPGRARADVVPGDRDGTSCAPALMAHVARHFADAGLRVAPTIPTRAASSPPTTAAPPSASTPSRSSCAATSTWTRTASKSPSPASAGFARPSTPSSPHCAR